MATTITPTRHVAASIHDAGIVLLDTVDGRLFASNLIGARIWQGLERRLTVDAIAADLSDHFRIPRERASAHTRRFLAELERRRLVAWSREQVTQLSYAWLVVRALYELTRYDVLHGLLRRPGFQRELAVRSIASREPGIDCEAAICKALLLATCLYWKPALCLQRSVCLMRLLRAYGVGARLVIGYRPVPFLSHAWVEVDGRVVNDSPVYQQRLRVLLTA